MNLADLRTDHYKPLLRAALEAGYARHRELDYNALFSACTERGGRLWREQIVPEFGAVQAEAFDKALWRVRMRAETSIPWPVGFGYAFGAACHALAGGRTEDRVYAATTAGLANFLVGLFDHLLDKHPREFGALGDLVGDAALKRYTLDRDLSAFVADPQEVLAAGLVGLYRLYLTRCHRLLGEPKDTPTASAWSDALRSVHEAERLSVTWKMSQVPVSPTMIEQSETPGLYAYWMIALVACLGVGEEGVKKKMEPFARRFIRFMRQADSVVDIEDDIRNDVWGGMVARIALEAHDQNDADRIVSEATDECVRLLQDLGNVSDIFWEPGDAFSLADILWAYV